MSASAFGAGASRPIIRGLEGSRVKMLENGMTVSDVSGLSNDHAVAAEGAIAQQIEILRGPAALLYGSGAIGGLVNVVNERIPTTLEPKPIGQVEARYSSVDSGRNLSGTADAAVLFVDQRAQRQVVRIGSRRFTRPIHRRPRHADQFTLAQQGQLAFPLDPAQPHSAAYRPDFF